MLERFIPALFPLLQWGRDQLVAEIFPPGTRPTGGDSLQWGRDQLVAEIAYFS